ncbi:MAG: VOC family protein [Selenomonadaceae bacterium]|nr:VOC family protein [Selenomonadaceae bacterium]
MKISHVAIYVHDLEREKIFFVKYFGAKSSDKYRNSQTGFSSYFLTFDDGARLEIMNRPTLKDSLEDAFCTGWHHIAIEVGDKKAVDDLTKKFRADGYRVTSEPRTTGDGYYESIILDDEGNRIELVAKR